MKMTLTPKDFTFDWFSGTGAGGQHRNKHQNCLRLTHDETGLKVTAQSFKTRQQNTREAFQKITPLLENFYNKPKERNVNTELVRSYKLEDGIIIDHRINKKYVAFDVDNIDLQQIIEDVLNDDFSAAG